MIEFAELESVSEQMIDGILENVERAALATAFQGASVRLIDRVLGRRDPSDIRNMLECVQHQQVASMAEIEQARRQVAQIADELQAAGVPAMGQDDCWLGEDV